ncbi:MAG: RNA methyltransferase [Candidatus Eremiobacteraeota bacterium]|nr:RNA methyltransferase [Candidatus Eremiobacteraeota bacterium]
MKGTAITSRHNRFYKKARSLKYKKNRDSERLFLVEGIRILEVLVNSNLPVSMVFYTRQVLESDRARSIVKNLVEKGDRNFIISGEMMEQLSPGKAPQGIVAVCSFLPSPGDEFGKNDGAYLVLENISDPGNLGAIFRTAWAGGANGLLLLGDCSDPYNPKAVRASAGGILKVPFITLADNGEFFKWLGEKEIVPVLALPTGGKSPEKFIGKKRIAVILGSEAHGISSELARQIDNKVSIPLATGVESLNIAVAAGILLYTIGKTTG